MAPKRPPVQPETPEVITLEVRREAPKRAPAAVWFESTNAEPVAFNVAGIRPIRNFTTGRLEWEVATDDADRFRANHFVQMGRVRPKG